MRLGSLRELAQQLDATPNLHSQHEASDQHLGIRTQTRSRLGQFYRIESPTGTGKSVAMVMMSIDAARRGHRVVIAVPTLVELENTVRILKQSLAVAAADLSCTIALSDAGL